MALTDIFAERYNGELIRGRGVPQEMATFFVQFAQIVGQDILPLIKPTPTDKLAREIGLAQLGSGRSIIDVCNNFLMEAS